MWLRALSRVAAVSVLLQIFIQQLYGGGSYRDGSLVVVSFIMCFRFFLFFLPPPTYIYSIHIIFRVCLAFSSAATAAKDAEYRFVHEISYICQIHGVTGLMKGWLPRSGG